MEIVVSTFAAPLRIDTIIHFSPYTHALTFSEESVGVADNL